MKKLFLFVCMVLLMSSCGEETNMNVPEKVENSGSAAQNETQNTENLTLFHHEILKLDFTYPTSWGAAILQEEKENGSQTGATEFVALAFQNPSKIMAAFASGRHSVERDLFWGDTAKMIQSQDDITKFCETNTSTTRKSCEVLQNAQGVNYVKYNDLVKEDSKDYATFYRVFNPQSPYFGIVFSDERLEEAEYPDLENLIQSIKLLP